MSDFRNASKPAFVWDCQGALPLESGQSRRRAVVAWLPADIGPVVRMGSHEALAAKHRIRKPDIRAKPSLPKVLSPMVLSQNQEPPATLKSSPALLWRSRPPMPCRLAMPCFAEVVAEFWGSGFRISGFGVWGLFELSCLYYGV